MWNRFNRWTRTSTGLIVLAFVLGNGLLRFMVMVLSQRRIPDRLSRASWLHFLCKRVAQVLHFDRTIHGDPPRKGLLVCNHLGYVDIILLSAITPCVFVSKFEVKHWPIFGWFASLAGTVFLKRTAHSSLNSALQGVQEALDTGTLVVLFPEGTTTQGHSVLPFKSPMLEAVIGRPESVSVGYIQYELPEGNVAEEVCYWGDMTLVPHLLNLLSKRRIRAVVSFSQPTGSSPNRKHLARRLHGEVVRLGNNFHGGRLHSFPRW